MAQPTPQHANLEKPKRNRYFYGKLLDVYHFEMEQTYFNSKRWLLNRFVTGPGVVCGLDVELTPDRQGVIVQPGLAIDRCGHEVIVTEPSRSATTNARAIRYRPWRVIVKRSPYVLQARFANNTKSKCGQATLQNE
jgi:hypothetical protein